MYLFHLTILFKVPSSRSDHVITSHQVSVSSTSSTFASSESCHSASRSGGSSAESSSIVGSDGGSSVSTTSYNTSSALTGGYHSSSSSNTTMSRHHSQGRKHSWCCCVVSFLLQLSSPQHVVFPLIWIPSYSEVIPSRVLWFSFTSKFILWHLSLDLYFLFSSMNSVCCYAIFKWFLFLLFMRYAFILSSRCMVDLYSFTLQY